MLKSFAEKVYRKLIRLLDNRHRMGHVYHQQLQKNARNISTAWSSHSFSPINDDNRLTVIVGAARTGTTLLQGILCSDPDTNPLISESVFLRQYIELHRDTSIYHNKFPGHYFSDETDLVQFFRGSLDGYFDHVQAIHQCNKLVLKHPALTRETSQLIDLYPNVRVVCLLRDPRAIVASLFKWKIKLLSRDKKHPFKSYKLRQFINFTNSFYAPLFNNYSDFYAEKILFVRYEDLVTNTQPTVKLLEEFTGLDLSYYRPDKDWSSVMFDYSDANSPVNAAVTPLYGKGISQSQMEAYKQQLSPKQVRKIERGCRALIDIFEYPLSVT